MATAAQGRSSSASSLKRVNKKVVSSRNSFSQRVNIPVLVATLGLVLYGILVIWTASLSISNASFPRHLVGVGLGAILSILVWRTDLRGLANMSTVLLVLDIIVIFSPYIPGLSYNAKGMTGWVQIPLIGLTFQPVELAKIITTFFIAGLGAQYNGHIDTVRDYVKLCGMLAVPFLCVLAAGDLGSGLVVFAGGAVIIMMSSLDHSHPYRLGLAAFSGRLGCRCPAWQGRPHKAVSDESLAGIHRSFRGYHWSGLQPHAVAYRRGFWRLFW